jgi:hypothetical protein
MDLNEHIGKIVEGLLDEISANVLVRVDSLISATISDRLQHYNYEAHIQAAATEALDRKASEYTIDSKRLEKRIADRIELVLQDTQSTTTDLINTQIAQKVAAVNFNQMFVDAMSGLIADRLQEFTFPEQSINATAIQFDNFTLSGDNIRGGLIEDFSSTGIDDRATGVAITVLDNATVIENNLYTKDLTVEGTAVISGNLSITGTMDKETNFFQDLVRSTASSTLSTINSNLFDNYSSLIFNKIKNEGINLSKILLNDREVITDNELGPTIINSNLQRLGLIKELQVSGETLLAETLYVTPKRVGINTIEPSGALSIWDQEVEIVAAKKAADTASFGTPRQQRMVLTSNNKENIVLEPNGSTVINDLRIGTMRFTTASQPPNYVSEPGHVVWNTNPSLGGPMGWICLGAANWANFGIID